MWHTGEEWNFLKLCSVQIVLAWAYEIAYILVWLLHELAGMKEANGGQTPSLVLVHELPHLAGQASLHDHHAATQLPERKRNLWYINRNGTNAATMRRTNIQNNLGLNPMSGAWRVQIYILQRKSWFGRPNPDSNCLVDSLTTNKAWSG